MIERREFLKMTGSASAAALMAPLKIHAGVPAASDVYEVVDKGMVDGTRADRKKVIESVVINDVDAVIKAMSNEQNVGTAWQKRFPGIKSNSSIAIKLNLLKNYNGPQFATLKAVVRGLKAMFNGAFTGEIAVFDNDWNGRKLKVDTHYGDYDLNTLGVWHKEDDYKGEQITVAGNTMNVSTRLSMADYGIEMSASRRHHLYAGKFTGMIKNMIGAVSRQTDSYKCLDGTIGGQFHDNANYQGFVDLFNNYMKANLHLYIADHILIPLDESKEFYDKIGNTVVIGTDPCAVDSRSIDILKKHYPKKIITKAVPEALAVAGIGTTSYNLKSVPVSGNVENFHGSSSRGRRISLSLDAAPFKYSQVSFFTGPISTKAAFDITTLEGRHVRHIPIPRLNGGRGLLSWDGRDKNGHWVKPGYLAVNLKNGDNTASGQLMVVK